jgi:hypothetical protein
MHIMIKQIPKRPRLRPVCEFTTANHRDGKVDGSRFFMENVTDEVWRREGPLYNGELLRKVDRGMLLRDPPGGW